MPSATQGIEGGRVEHPVPKRFRIWYHSVVPELKQRILQRARELGFDAVGVAPAMASPHAPDLEAWLADGKHGDMQWLARDPARRSDARRALPGARSVISVAMGYLVKETSDGHNGSGVVARYARHSDYHKVMERMLKQLARFVEETGGDGTVARTAVDTTAILEREYAQRAGIAWVGKSTMALSRELGQWFLLGEVITTLELPPDEAAKNRCGSCTRCIEACPTRAITAPYQLDARRCIAYLTIELKDDIPEEFREAVGNRIFGCDDCLEVCPWNRFASESRVFRASYRGDLRTLDPRVILQMSEEEFHAKFDGTPIRRLGLERLQRNACVVLGNVGEDSDAPLLRETASQHPNAMVRRHATWALTILLV